jgi:homogentisate 1,2-dioxygenase
VKLLDSVERGSAEEILGRHYWLPEIGPVGVNGFVLPRNFGTPAASLDVYVMTTWVIVVTQTRPLFV